MKIILEDIKKIVEEVTLQDIGRNSREAEVVLARNIYFYLARDRTKFSLARIGKYVNRNHASVLHGIKTLEGWMSYDTEVVSLFTSVVEVLDRRADYYDDLDKSKEFFVVECLRVRSMNAKLVETNLRLREEIKTLSDLISKRTDYLVEQGYVQKKGRAGTGYKKKVRQQIQLESAELGV